MIRTGYCTSRTEIIEWVNHLLITNLGSIEQLGAGNIYCQLLEAAFPGKVPLGKVKWHAYLEVDFLHNFRILQAGFQRLGISKSFDPQKLAKARYQDNLEFVQWMKGQLGPKIEENGVYNALAARNNHTINLLFAGHKQFDLRQTMGRNKENKENKENLIKKTTKMVNSLGTARQQPKEPILRTNRSVLGIKPMNLSCQETEKPEKKVEPMKKMELTRRIEPFKRSQADKENVQLSSVGGSDRESRLRRQKLTVLTKSIKPRPIFIKAVQVIHSDEEEECF